MCSSDLIRERAAGRWPVSRALEHFHSIAGPSHYRRIDVHVPREQYDETKRRLLVELRRQAPSTLAGQAVTTTLPLSTNDGYKFFVADGSWLLEGLMPLQEIKSRLDLDELPDEEAGHYNTLAGMMLYLLGRLPIEGQSVSWSGWTFEVVDMDGRRIDKVLASKPRTA